MAVSLGGFAGFMLSKNFNFVFGQQVLSSAKAKSVIVLWLGGGPSQIDTFDPKPGRETGGEFKAVETSVKEIMISEHFQRLSKVMEHISLIRSMTSKEGSHERGAYLLHTGYLPQSSFQHPSLGSVVSFEKSESLDIPNYVTINSQGFGPAFLGYDHAPFSINNPQRSNEIVKLLDDAKDRLGLLKDIDKEFNDSFQSENSLKRDSQYKKLSKLRESEFGKALDFSSEKPELVDRYGKNNFGYGCLLAKRLVERGTRFVEISLGGWDTHQDNFNKTKKLIEILDPAFGTLVDDLNVSGLLANTIVLCMGEFGRTPKINKNNGRDHYPQAFSVAIAGGGIKGGRVIGETDADGLKIVRDPVQTPDLFATIMNQLGVSPDKKLYSHQSGVVKVTDNGKVIKDLIS